MLIDRQGLGLQCVANSTSRPRVLNCAHGGQLDGSEVRLLTQIVRELVRRDDHRALRDRLRF